MVTVNRGSAPHRILAQLSGIQQTTSLVIAFCCEPRLGSLILREARRLNMLNGDWVWLALEQAVGRWTMTSTIPSASQTAEMTSADWPLGLLGLVSQQPLRLTKHTMKGSLAILHSAVRASLAVHQLPNWLSSWNDTLQHSTTNSSSWAGRNLRLQVAKKLDRYRLTFFLLLPAGQPATVVLHTVVLGLIDSMAASSPSNWALDKGEKNKIPNEPTRKKNIYSWAVRAGPAI